ncbi:MAG: hypothetical protein LBR37_04455 [Erysipelotrichaceae bacterium]|jgi:hypothetical protein|nr:hypothetical protein [Erysipelotrichaceae bacterium]
MQATQSGSTKEEITTYIIASRKNYASDEYLSFELGAGYYHARVVSKNGWGREGAEYTLSGSVRYLHTKSEKISDLRYNKGAKAALWVSDFDPASIPPGMETNDTFVENSLMKFNRDGKTVSGFEFNRMLSDPRIKNASEIEHTVLYLWDIEMRTQLYNFFIQLYDLLENDYQLLQNERIKAENIELEYTYVTTATDVVIITIDIVLTVLSISNPVTLVISGALLLLDIVSMILEDIFAPDFTNEIVKVLDAKEYCAAIASALDCDPDLNEYNQYEAVRIPLTYKIRADNMTFLGIHTHFDYYIDYIPHVTTRKNMSSHIYKVDTINYMDSANIFTGYIYGLTGSGDLTPALNRNLLPLNYVNTSTPQDIYLDDEDTQPLLGNGEYHYYRFTAPENGEYRFYSTGTSDVRGSLHRQVVIYPYTDHLLASDDNSGTINNFQIDYRLNRDETVYLRVYEHLTPGIDRCGVIVRALSQYPGELRTISKHLLGLVVDRYSGTFYDRVYQNGTNFVCSIDGSRVGLIDDYLTLSAKKANVTEAFLTFNFESDLTFVEFDMGVWSRSEGLTTVETSINLEYFDATSNIWRVAETFDAKTMNLKEQMETYDYVFSTPVSGVRIFISTNLVNNDNNRGRVCLDNFKFVVN